MRLERLKIEGFRSLKSVEWKPEALNVLIGKNASGKSNFLRALELIRAAANAELEKTVLSMGGMAPLVWNGTAPGIRFEWWTASESETRRCSLNMQRVGTTGGFQLEAQTDDPDHGPLFSYDPEPGVWSVYHDLRVDQTAPVRQSAVTRYEKYLDPDGQNLAPVLFTLQGSKEFEEEVDNAMFAAFPEAYEKLKFTPLEHGRMELGLRWKGNDRLCTAADLSDGTLRFLMLVAILANPEPPPLIAIDEPETGLHPRMLRIIAELAEQAAMKSQVILSTHSPQLLDVFEHDSPPAVTVFEWVEDHTEMRTLAGEQLKYWIENYTLGKFVFSGEAEAVS